MIIIHKPPKVLTKEYLMFRDVVCLWNPDFLKSEDVCRWHLENSFWYESATGKLVEKTIGIIGNILLEEGIEDDAHDFSDDSDNKTGSVLDRPGNVRYGEITGVYRIENGMIKSEKIGALRITFANLITGRCDFLYIPKSVWRDHPYSKQRGHIRFQYDVPRDRYYVEGSRGVFRTDNAFDMANYHYIPKKSSNAILCQLSN